jgi:hypothetical protein
MARQAILIGSSVVGILSQKSVTTQRLRRNLARLESALRTLPGDYAFQVHTLVDRPPREIRTALDRAAERAHRSDSLLLMYYFGHGALSRELGLDLVACGNPRTFQTFPVTLFQGPRQAHGVARTLTILDCCYAGASERQLDLGGTRQHALMAAVTASSKAYVRAESTEPPIGVFTNAVLGGLTSKEATEQPLTDNRITASGLFRYAHAETMEITQRIQEPVFIGTLTETLTEYQAVPTITPGTTEWAKPKSGYGKLRAICSTLSMRGSFHSLDQLYAAVLREHEEAFRTFYKESDTEFKHLPSSISVVDRYVRFLRSLDLVDEADLRLTADGRALLSDGGNHFNERLLAAIDKYLARHAVNRSRIEKGIQWVLGRREMPTMVEIGDYLSNNGVRVPRVNLGLILDLCGYVGALRMSLTRVYFHW